MKNSMQVPWKVQTEVVYDPALPLLGIHPDTTKSASCGDIYTLMFMLALFTIANIRKYTKCSLWMHR
jgi:hypothetical protein